MSSTGLPESMPSPEQTGSGPDGSTSPGSPLPLRPPQTGRPQLERARQLIEQQAVSVLSLDMFDTLVWRKVPRPTDAFILLGQELLSDGLLDPGLSPATFRRLRIHAEAMARLTKEAGGAGSEVTLDEIWATFPDHLLRQSRGLLADREVHLERRVTVPDLDLVELAAFAVERGVRLAVVSNTYLTERHLGILLARPGLESLINARLYPSSAYGVNKSNGLWKIVLHDLGVPPTSILHVGDEQLSDVDVPLEHGIRVAPHYRLLPGVGHALEREGALIPDPVTPSPANVDPYHGDYGITGIRTKVAARSHSNRLPEDLAVAWRFGATVLGPVLTGFAEWVHSRAKDLGVERLWCPMREGELLSDLLNTVATHRGSDISAHPIWLSRHVTSRAAMGSVTEQELRALADRRVSPTVRDYVRNLGLSESEVPEIASWAGRRMEAAGMADHVIGVLINSTHLRARILDEAAAARRRLLAHLRVTVGNLDEPLVLVDLGWGGTIQFHMQKLFDTLGIDVPVVGLYASTNAGALGRVLEGCRMESYLTTYGFPEFEVNQISRTPEIIEQVCVSSTGSVADFDEEGTPKLDASVPPPDQIIQKAMAQHGIRAFQREWHRYESSVDGWQPLDGSEAPHLLNILSTSIFQPSADEARVFGSWAHDDNFGTSNADTVVPEELGTFVPYLTPSDLLEMTTRDSYWPYGLAARYDPSLGAATTAVLQGRVPPLAFEPSRRIMAARLSVDAGAGFGPPVQRPLRTNRNGLSYLHFSIRHPGVNAVRLELCDQPAAFRVDWIDLELEVEGVNGPLRIRLEGEAAMQDLMYPNCHRLYEGVVLGLHGPPVVVIPLTGRAPGLIDRVDLRFAGAVMPVPVPARPVPLGPEAPPPNPSLLTRARSEVAAGGIGAVGKGALRAARRRLKGEPDRASRPWAPDSSALPPEPPGQAAQARSPRRG